MTLPVHRLAARLARRATQDTLASWGLDHLEETAVLLVSELVSNAVRYACADLVLEVGLEACGTCLRVEVLDANPDPPLPRAPAALDESGFGFALIEALADKWGVRETATGKGVRRHVVIRLDRRVAGDGLDLQVDVADSHGSLPSSWVSLVVAWSCDG